MVKKGDTLTNCYYDKLVKEASKNKIGELLILDKQDMCYLLGVLFHVPKHSQDNVLKDLLEYGMIEQVSRGRAGIKYRILGC